VRTENLDSEVGDEAQRSKPDRRPADQDIIRKVIVEHRLRLDDRKHALFYSVVEQRFHNLQKTILRWDQETEDTRAAMARTAGEPGNPLLQTLTPIG